MKSKALKLTPYFTLCSFDEGLKAADKFNFKPKELRAYELANGFIEVIFSWRSDSGTMKYVDKNFTSFGGGGASSLTVEFPDVKFRYKDEDGKEISWDCFFDVEIGLKNQGEIEYEPLFVQNLKYEVAAYFAPKGWNCRNKLIWEEKL